MFDNPSVLAQVHISPEAFKRFCESPVQPRNHFDDYLEWLESKEWQGKDTGQTAARIIDEAGVGNRDFCCQELEEFSFQNYDSEEQTFTLFWMEYSINYSELLQFLNSFRQIADFKDLPNDDFLVVGYADWNSDETELVLRIRKGSSSILNPDDPDAEEILKSANILAEIAMEKLSTHSGL